MPANVALVQQLNRAKIYLDYARAFSGVTKLPLALRAPGAGPLAHRGQPHENPFCALMAASSRTCAACLEVQRKIAAPPGDRTRSVTCFAGLSDTVVPVQVGKRLIGFLQTGQVALKEPTAEQFERICARLVDWGIKVDLARLKEAYFRSRVLSSDQYRASVHLLEIFAVHLALIANQLAVQQSAAEPPLIGRARALIDRHQQDVLTLEQVVKTLHVSTSYFCKLFKKTTGLTFTNYLGRVRVERAKTLLLNPNRRVSEVAYETGFQSLTHFNRTFRDVVGLSPTGYRARLSSPKA